MLKRFLPIILITVFFFIFISTPSHAFWWMVYHKPEFKGKVIDAETKEPIEGAVVVVTYSKHVFRFMPESGSVIFDVKETLTDKEGIFSIPSYTTIVDPLAWESNARFIIFKPGYGSFPNWRISPSKGTEVDFEDFFSEYFGKERDAWWKEPWKGTARMPIKVTFGVVKLPKLKTREERIKAKPAPVGKPSDWKKQKQFIKAIRDEWQYLYNEDPKDLYKIIKEE